MPRLMKVVRMLKGGIPLQRLVDKYSLKTKFHPEFPLVILNYDQVHSPKEKKVVRECRSLVLDTRTWDVVARTFYRFFNVGECPSEFGLFDQTCFSGISKEDGSLFTLFCFEGHWIVMTRGTFAEGNMEALGMGPAPTWEELFWTALGLQGWDLSRVQASLDPGRTWGFEICSLYNKVVRTYSEPTAYLLVSTAVDNYSEYGEYTEEQLDGVGFLRPQRWQFHSLDEVKEHVLQLEAQDRTLEGVVLRDKKNRRWKLKTKSYLELHRLLGNTSPTIKRMLPIVLRGEESEVLAYFPEHAPFFQELKQTLQQWRTEIEALWGLHRGISDQKEFAMAVKSHPLSGILFHARSKNLTDLSAVWDASEGLLLKVLENSKR